MKSLILLAALATLAPMAVARTPKVPAPRPAKAEAVLAPVVLKKNVKLDLEIADNDSLRTQGLSGRRTLDWNRGMLFVFPESSRRSFWMIDCHFDIDVAYVTQAGVVREIVPMRIQPGVPMDQLDHYPSGTADIAYALETNRGWFQAHGISEGDTLAALTRWKTRR